jgi:hypothetical protein
LIVEIEGVETRDASTLDGVLNAIVTIPLLYMIKLDGFGSSRFGTHGLLWTDAAANALVFVVVAVVFVACGLGLRRVSGTTDSDTLDIRVVKAGRGVHVDTPARRRSSDSNAAGS